MNETPCRVGFAFCGSFCTFSYAMSALEAVKARFGDVTPIVSENSAALDTRFGEAHNWLREMERICDKRVIDTLPKAEPIGPKKLLDALVICPCTGNTLGKLAAGITDTTVTLAAKVEALKKDASTDFLFGSVTREGWKPGEGGDGGGKPGGGKKPSEMSYAELAEYLAANPDAKLD